MHTHADRLATTAAMVAIVGSAALAACSSGTGGGPASSQAAAPSTTSAVAPTSGAPGAAQISPNGVTTAVEAPAESTEDEYFQACNAAKVWMDQQGGDPKTKLEPYLATVQKSDAPGPGTFGAGWSRLTPGRQAAVIVAAQAAADGLCS